MSKRQKQILGTVLLAAAGAIEAAWPEYSKPAWALLGVISGAIGIDWGGDRRTGPTVIR